MTKETVITETQNTFYLTVNDLEEAMKQKHLYADYALLDETWKKRFDDYMTGKKTMPLTYDPFFKCMFHPDRHPDWLSHLLSAILGESVVVEQILLAVIIRRCCNHNKIRIRISGLRIQRCCQLQLLLRQIFLDILILNRTNPVIDFLYFLRDNINCHHLMMLCIPIFFSKYITSYSTNFNIDFGVIPNIYSSLT